MRDAHDELQAVADEHGVLLRALQRRAAAVRGGAQAPIRAQAVEVEQSVSVDREVRGGHEHALDPPRVLVHERHRRLFVQVRVRAVHLPHDLQLEDQDRDDPRPVPDLFKEARGERRVRVRERPLRVRDVVAEAVEILRVDRVVEVVERVVARRLGRDFRARHRGGLGSGDDFAPSPGKLGLRLASATFQQGRSVDAGSRRTRAFGSRGVRGFARARFGARARLAGSERAVAVARHSRVGACDGPSFPLFGQKPGYTTRDRRDSPRSRE
eukprot:31285-Pelagococcus_subviridis.AAC.4